MVKNITDRTIMRLILGLQVLYFEILLVLVLVTAYMFVDYIIFFILLFFSIAFTLFFTMVYIRKAKEKGINLEDKLITLLLLQLPSTAVFAFCIFAVWTSKMIEEV